MSSDISKVISQLTKKSFGAGGQFIVDATHPSPSGAVMEWCYTLTDVTGFSASNNNIVVGSGDFPDALVAGVELPSGLYDISVNEGYLMCFLK